MRQRTAFPRLIGAALFIVVLAACSRGPETPAEPPEQVVVIATNSGRSVPGQLPVVLESITQAMSDERGVDPSDQPYQDLAENPNSDPGDDESPQPHGSSSTSAIGVGGGMGGGGGKGGRGGFEHRRARGGGGIPRKHDDRATAAHAWLAAHQHRDGMWRPEAFGEDSSRTGAKVTGNEAFGITSDKGESVQQVEATCWALLAFATSGYDHKEGTFRNTVRNALIALRSIQRNDGGMGKPEEDTLCRHALFTAAASELYGLSGDWVLKRTAEMALRLLIHDIIDVGPSQFPDGDGTDFVSTVIALRALHSAAIAGLEAGDLAKARGELAQHVGACAKIVGGKLVFERKTAGFPHATSGMKSDEILWLAAWWLTGGDSADPRAKLAAKSATAPDALPRWENGWVDYRLWLLGSWAMFQAGGQCWDAWEKAFSKAMLDSQRGYTEADKQAGQISEHGSWDVTAPGQGGRVVVTAQGALMMGTYYAYLRENRTKPDKDGDGLRDAVEALNGQMVETRPQPAAATQGQMMARRGADWVGEFPLKLTRVNTKVSGTVASTTVTQTFTNPYSEAIEAVYRFPLPGDSAICDFVMECNGRRIRGMVRTREEAVRIYREAKARGQTASLLTQERTNVFTQRVANIAVREQVEVTVTFFQTLVYREGRYEYVFPMTVAPRYGSSAPAGSAPANDDDGDGTADDDDGVNAPLLPAGMRSGHDVRISVDIDAGMPVDMTRLRSVNHVIDVSATRTGRAIATLHPAETIPNRDFVLHWSIAGAAPAVGLVTQREGDGGYFSLQVQPQADARDADVTPREITFILDDSGSMVGAPAQMSREIIRRSLDRLRPDDLFNIVYFASGNEQLFEKPAASTAANVEKAREMLGRPNAGGGTAMLAGLYRALDATHDPRYLQMYAFLTDGLVTEDDAILATIQKRGAGARFFAFGAGSSVNRALIDGIAQTGNGRAIYAMPRDGKYADTAVGEFFDAIDSPVLCDIDIDWGGLPVEEVMPRAPKDLFASQPIVLHGRFTQAAQGKVLVRGRVGARHVVYEVPVNLGADNTNPAVGTIWARKKIDQLTQDKLGEGDATTIIAEITDLALRYNLASEYTSFVAVDESRIVSNGSPLRVFQPVEMPENVELAGDAEVARNSRSVRVPGWGLVAGETGDGSVLVLKVEDGSAAANAGMRPGQVLRKVGGLKVRNLDSLESTLQQAKAGAKISIEAELVDDGEVHNSRFDLPDPAGK